MYITIIEWCWTKLPEETLEDYLIKNDLVRKSGIKNGGKDFLKKNKDKLKATNIKEFDVTFLHELLPIVCHAHIENPGTELWESKVQLIPIKLSTV